MVPFPISYDSEEQLKIAKEFYKLNMRKRKKSKEQEISNWCEKNLVDVDGKSYSYMDIVCALPSEINNIVKYIDNSKIICENNHALKYIVDSLYVNMRKEARLFLFKYVNSKACPYCNRNYVYVDNRIKACDFDHIYPKSKYPILAASFFNLVPSCPICNRYKGDEVLSFKPYNNYSYEKVPHFSIKLLDVNYQSNEESIQISFDSNYFSDEIDKLKLLELYNSHKEIVQQVFEIRQRYYNGEIKDMVDNFNLDKEKIKKLLLKIPASPDEFSKDIFSKLRYETWWFCKE